MRGTGKTIYVVGFGSVRIEGDGTVRARAAVVEYLAGMAEFGQVVWLAPEMDEGSELSEPLPDGVSWQRLRKWTASGIPHGALVVGMYPLTLMQWVQLALRRGPLVFYVGNDLFAVPDDVRSVRGVLAWIRRMFGAVVLSKKARLVVARGRALATQFRRLNANVIETIPITMPLPAPSGPRAIDRPYVIFVGKMLPEKGVDVLLEAYATAEQGLPDLAFVGVGPMEAEVAAAANKDPRLHFIGYLNDPSALARLYAGASAMILPTRATWEGVPRVLSEAQSYGVPLLTTPLPTIHAEFDGQATFFERSDMSAQDIVDALRAVPAFDGFRKGGVPGAAAAARQHVEAVFALERRRPKLDHETVKAP